MKKYIAIGIKVAIVIALGIGVSKLFQFVERLGELAKAQIAVATLNGSNVSYLLLEHWPTIRDFALGLYILLAVLVFMPEIKEITKKIKGE